MADEHVVHIERVTRLGGPWRWVCTCGRRSKLVTFAGSAEAAGRQHVKAVGVHVR